MNTEDGPGPPPAFSAEAPGGPRRAVHAAPRASRKRWPRGAGPALAVGDGLAWSDLKSSCPGSTRRHGRRRALHRCQKTTGQRTGRKHVQTPSAGRCIIRRSQTSKCLTAPERPYEPLRGCFARFARFRLRAQTQPPGARLAVHLRPSLLSNAGPTLRASGSKSPQRGSDT